ncbi:agmatinase [Algoriphagus namhaensis]|uniref:Agmatinase n=1 Tax=Algoriphagus namhaensis TaxID=915353 RepID=A0ABV8AUK6_9BACT
MLKLLGIPFDANSSFLKGPSYAPDRIRLMDKEGSANRFAENGIEVIPGETYADLGDLSFESTDPKKAFELIRTRVFKEISSGERLLSIGGDHSVSFPIIDAHSEVHKGLNILHFDAHADLYENFDNNPFSHASPFARLMETGRINSLTQVGLRTLSTHQRDQANRYGVKIIEMKDLNEAFLHQLKGPLYISLDLDVLDPAFAPGVSHHEPGGMSTRELISFIQKVPLRVIGADLVEYNPMRDTNSMTAMVGYKLMKELMVKML